VFRAAGSPHMLWHSRRTVSSLTTNSNYQPFPSPVSLFLTRERTPRPCSVCGARRLSRRGDRRLVGARFGRWREDTFGRARSLTLRYSLPLSVWVDPLAEHTCFTVLFLYRVAGAPHTRWHSLRRSRSLTSNVLNYEVRLG